MAIFSKFRSKLYHVAKFIGDDEAILSGNPKKNSSQSHKKNEKKQALWIHLSA